MRKWAIAGGALFVAVAAGFADRSVWDGVYSEEQANRGESLYQKECSRCHGVSLTGGEEAPPLAGGAFLANWNGTTAGDLFERIRTTMPPDAPGRLSRQQQADVLGHVFRANGFPAGKSELPRETEILKQIRIDAAKP
jgi:S-disulfanyl-L-cysteine oxidoreductase SoxD